MNLSFHYLSMANQAMLQKKLLAALHHTDLTLGQPKVLDYLKEHNGDSQKDIAKGCHIEAASLTSILNRMEEKKLIERRMLHGNRRSYYIYLTETGQKYQEIVDKTFQDLENDIFQGISEEDKAQFMKTFLQIYQNMTEKE